MNADLGIPESVIKLKSRIENSHFNTKRTGIIIFSEEDHLEELNKDLKFDKNIDPETKLAVTEIIKEYWDYFVTAGAKRTILG